MIKIKEGFKLCPVGDEFVVVAQGAENIDFSKVISLNESGAYLWNRIYDREFDASLLAELLQEHYDVDPAIALSDSEVFIERMKNAGVI